jgi:subtilisin family serine protease
MLIRLISILVLLIASTALTVRADDAPVPNLDTPPPNTDGSGNRSRNFTHAKPGGGGSFGGYSPYTVDGQDFQVTEQSVPLSRECQQVTDGAGTSTVRNVRFLITPTQPNLETRGGRQRAVFNSHLRAIFDFQKNDPAGLAPEVKTELQTSSANFLCWVEGTPQPRPGVLRVHSPAINTDGRSSGGAPQTGDADGPRYMTRTSGDLDIDLDELKDDLVKFAGDFTGEKKVVCQVTIRYRLLMNDCIVKEGSYLRSFETSIIGTRSLDDANRIEYTMGVPQSGGAFPEPQSAKSVEKKDGERKEAGTAGKDKVGFLPQPRTDGQEYAYRVAVQEPNECVSTTYRVDEGDGFLLTSFEPGEGPVFEIGQGGRRDPDSAGPPPPPNTPPYTDGTDQQVATPGWDELTGGPGRDEFIFGVDPDFPDSPRNTINEGDRITDYESGETIIIEGDLLSGDQISLEYDEQKDETRLGIDLDKDGRPDRTIILDGDKRGSVRTSGNCCGVRTSEIYIDLPPQQAGDGGDQGQKSTEKKTEQGGTTDKAPKTGTTTGEPKKTTTTGDDNLKTDGKTDGKKAEAKPKVNRPPHTDGDDTFEATPGPDEFTGGKGKDTYFFDTDRDGLDDGDRITDYESGEEIIIKGFRVGKVDIKYDELKDETRLEIDTNGDGKADRAIILNGDKRGTLGTMRNCCGSRMTTIQIELTKQRTAEKQEAPKAEEKKEPKAQDQEPPSTPSTEITQDGDDSEQGLVKATRSVLLVVKSEQTGQPIEDFVWKIVDDDPDLPVADPGGQPAETAVSSVNGIPTSVATDAYAADVTGGRSGKDGGVVLASYTPTGPNGQPTVTMNGAGPRPALTKNGSGLRPVTKEVFLDQQPMERLIVGTTGQPPAQVDGVPSLPAVLNGLGFDIEVTTGYRIGDTSLLLVNVPTDQVAAFTERMSKTDGVKYVEPDPCWKKKLDDPYYLGKGAWGQDFDDQWAIKRVGFTDDSESAWALLGDSPADVTVAIIDTGIDWNHPDLAANALWRNKGEIPGNGIDDDGNGYVDDVIGWDFIDGDNRPWDHDGHGTFTSGLIAAARNNGTGIAGINPHARIMVLRALDAFGQGHASLSAAAIAYAVDNGARVINLSLGGEGLTRTGQLAVDYARQKGAVVVVAAGNEASEVAGVAPGGLEGVITVTSTDRQDRRVGFSNYGPGIDIAAPGVEVLSLRGRNTDLLAHIRDVDYEVGKGVVGEDRAYFRASGTSFSAPIVAGTVSLLFSRNPKLTGEQAARMVLHSARDIETPGIDNFTGYGILDAVAALKADPAFFVESRIAGIKVVKGKKGPALQLHGTADAEKFAGAVIELGQGEEPGTWKSAAPKLSKPVRDGLIAEIPATSFKGARKWTIRVISTHKNGRKRESRYTVTLG